MAHNEVRSNVFIRAPASTIQLPPSWVSRVSDVKASRHRWQVRGETLYYHFKLATRALNDHLPAHYGTVYGYHLTGFTSLNGVLPIALALLAVFFHIVQITWRPKASTEDTMLEGSLSLVMHCSLCLWDLLKLV